MSCVHEPGPTWWGRVFYSEYGSMVLFLDTSERMQKDPSLEELFIFQDDFQPPQEEKHDASQAYLWLRLPNGLCQHF